MYEEFYEMARILLTREISTEFLYITQELTEVQTRPGHMAQR